MAVQQSVASIHHLHPIGETCPTCDQPIPHDRAEEIARRLEEQEKRQATELTTTLQAGFELKLTEVAEQTRLETATMVAAARAEAETAAQARIAEAMAAAAAVKAALETMTVEAQAAKDAAATTHAELTEQIAQFKQEADAKLAQVRAEAAATLETAKAEAAQAATATAQARIAEATKAEATAKAALEAMTAEAQAVKDAAAKTHAELTGQLAQSKQDADAKLAQVQTEAAVALETARAEAARTATAAAASQIQEAQESKTAAEAATIALRVQLEASAKAAEEAIAQAKSEAAAAADARVSEAEAARQAAEVQATTAAGELETLRANQQASLSAALKEQRDVLETDKASAISAERSAAFEEKQKLSERLEAVQRQLDKKTAEELGEGAEIDLFERLKAEFEGDVIVRVKKGLPGADIIHTLVHNGQVCGKIIYDSKNHAAWRAEFITKLRADQLAEGAEHAILTAMKFPAGTRQLHLQDGVLVANPARVLAAVQLIRRHMVQSHILRMSAQQRIEKTAALYTFITSEQCAGMFERLAGFSQNLLDIQEAERAAHDRVWKQQGLAIRGGQKVQAELQNEIDSIIGTLSAPESQP
jgi:hypothetical protein